jgi:hypothetical protein
LGELLKQGLDALDIVDGLQMLADERNVPLDELLKQAMGALEREGV